jgi:DNA replication and repair protein RecF
LALIESLEVQRFRNINHESLVFSKCFNFICGINGSGKTALLEAIYMLSTSKSFRSNLSSDIISHQEKDLLLFAKLLSDDMKGSTTATSVGISKGFKNEVHLNGRKIDSLAELAKKIPLRVIFADSFDLLVGGSSERRKFLDWGVFHVEHDFSFHLKNYKKIIKQRNSALKLKLSRSEVTMWNDQLVFFAEKINQSRLKYVSEIFPIIKEMLTEFLVSQQVDDFQYNLSYYSGWDEELNLLDILEKNLEIDYRLGHTKYGIHKADIDLKINNKKASKILSRGQLKIIICLMILSQVDFLKEKKDQSAILMIDDILSELDTKNQKYLLSKIEDLNVQTFITSPTSFISELQNKENSKMFYVEQGKYQQITN